MFDFKGTMKTLQKRINAHDDIVVIDVREKAEYQQGHIPNALLIPLSEVEQHLEQIAKDKDVYVYCRSGQRARSALRFLEKQGYKNVENAGGIIHWQGDVEVGD